MDRLQETIQIIKLLCTKPKARFERKFYKIKDAISTPKPIQKPISSIIIGSDGENRTLKIVVKYADYCNLFFVPNLEHKLEVLKNHCKDVGRDYEEVGKRLFASWPSVFVTESEDELTVYLIHRVKQNNISVEKIKKDSRNMLKVLGWIIPEKFWNASSILLTSDLIISR